MPAASQPSWMPPSRPSSTPAPFSVTTRNEPADAFPAFVLAASAAASGRDRLAGAPALPPAAAPSPLRGDDLLAGLDWVHVARAVADLSQTLSAGLAAAAADAPDPATKDACHEAATYAARIHRLLAGARRL